jgi:hypothetical protein
MDECPPIRGNENSKGYMRAMARGHNCVACKRWCNDAASFRQHCQSSGHQKKVAALKPTIISDRIRIKPTTTTSSFQGWQQPLPQIHNTNDFPPLPTNTIPPTTIPTTTTDPTEPTEPTDPPSPTTTVSVSLTPSPVSWPPSPTSSDSGIVASGGVRHNNMYLGEGAGFGEGDEVEFKSSFDVRWQDRYRHTMNAFLNTKGGILYFGIRDDGTVIGVPCGVKTSGPQGASNQAGAIDRLKLWVDDTQYNLFQPPVTSIKIQTVKLTANLAVWLIVVPKNDAPVYFKNTIYHRLNASTVVQKQHDQLFNQDQWEQRCAQYKSTIHSLELDKQQFKEKLQHTEKKLQELQEQHTILGNMTKSLIAKIK